MKHLSMSFLSRINLSFMNNEMLYTFLNTLCLHYFYSLCKLCTHKFISLRGFEKKNLNVWVRLFGFISSFPCIPILNRGAGAVPLLTYSKVCTTTKIFLDFTVVLSFIVVRTIYRIFKNVISCLLASEFSITPTF